MESNDLATENFQKKASKRTKPEFLVRYHTERKRTAYHGTIKHPLSLQTPRALSLREDRRDVSDANATQTYAHHSSQEWAFPLSLSSKGVLTENAKTI